MNPRRLPIVAIAGRPNTGKSTLFNRLLHKRRAITGPEAGLTRDPVFCRAELCGKPLMLVDTGGFKLDRARNPEDAALEELVVDRALGILEQAGVVILLLDAENITGEDEEFIETLRPLQNRLIVAVNKTEGGRKTAEAWNVLRYGFETIYMISAEHGDNIDQLVQAVASRLEENTYSGYEYDYDTFDTETIRITLAGKPNTGKSTLSNRLTASAASIVTPVPGTTRDVLEGEFAWKGKRFLVCDTAGIRRKTKVTQNIEYYSVNRAIKTMDDADIVILLINAPENISDQDKKIAALACERGRGVLFALNKWDLMEAIPNARNAAADKLRYAFSKMQWAPIAAISALTGEGIAALLSTCVKMKEQLHKQTPTSAFNAALEEWQRRYPPPSGPLTRFKIKYGVQTGINPVVFRLFVSRPEACKQNYMSYITRQIREELGYSLIPIKVELQRSGAERRGKNKEMYQR
ncbi:MAG: ribosome biogenesis GTPase Der [Spirochaetaceae bacterium]|jgi:GTP-binding protein|nr:ribosome biogenesis GTPase Der [Spirochaetaceae bacterium]